MHILVHMGLKKVSSIIIYNSLLLFLFCYLVVIAKANDGISRSVFQGGDCFWQIENATVQYNG